MGSRIDILDLIQIGKPSTFFPENVDVTAFEAFTGVLNAVSEAGTPADVSAIVSAIEAQTTALTVGTGLQEAELSDELWTGQTAIIAAEILYIDQLQAQFRAKRLEVEKDHGILYDFFQEIIEATLGTVVADIIAGYVPALAPIAGFLTEFGIGFLMDQLAMLLMNGNAMLDGIKAEDVAIKDMTKSLSNYTYRESVILRHIQQIDAILRQINEAEAALRQEIKITQPVPIDKWGGTTDDTFDGWDSVVSSLETSIAQIETWMKGIEDGDAENLPVPAPPQLPSVPDGAGKAITLKVAYLLVKYLITFMSEAHRKARETDTHMTDLVEAVNDLKFNGVRFHTSAGDMVELTGIGTVAESYDS